MPDIASTLKTEISRLARKEIKAETGSLRKSISSYRSEIASLKRRLADLEKSLRKVAKPRPRAEVQTDDAETRLRFRAAGFAAHRQRLGLTAAECGKLLGVSSLSVYKWESSKAQPRRSYLPAIAALRAMGKREAQAKLEGLAG